MPALSPQNDMCAGTGPAAVGASGRSRRPVRLLLDLDGTVCYNAAGDVMSQVLGVPLPAGGPAAWIRAGLLGNIGITPAQFWRIFTEHEEEIYGHAVPLPEAAASLRELKAAGAFIAVVTARRPSAAAVTHRWLSRHQVPFDVLEMGYDDKLPAAMTHELNWALEDDLHVAAALARSLQVILITSCPRAGRGRRRLHRRGDVGFRQVHSWREVPGIIKSGVVHPLMYPLNLFCVRT